MGTKEGEGVSGKYILIEAPNFNNAQSEAEAMSSYLRLGAVKDFSLAANPNAPKATGEDLACEIMDFIDDTRVREGCPDYLTPEVRQAETAKLHTKGGWRDHSDGNRVSTTRGDKVEVIKGNYRMVVMGRQHDVAGWDVSGGHVAESGITFDGASSIEYTTEDYNGTWVVVEKTIKGHVHSAYHGKVFDYYCGEIVESITGSEAPNQGQPNPVVTDRTWAESISSYTGSAALPIPSITNDTWVDAMTDTTNAGTMTSTTTAGAITDTTTVGTMTSTTTAGTIVDTTTAGAMISTTISNIEDTTIGTSLSTIIGMENETVIGAMSELTVGTESSIIVGMETSVNLSIQSSLTVGVDMSMALSASLSMVLGASLDIFLGLQINVTAAVSIDITPFSLELDGMKLIM
ncbi:MAG: hypothetical protein HOW73_49315 [Polyangiaceae bacterium]|nr:hypothetical protein [Polyangiaceae bacterium]